MIESVDRLGAELDPYALRYLRVLDERQVPIVDDVSADSIKSPRERAVIDGRNYVRRVIGTRLVDVEIRDAEGVE